MYWSDTLPAPHHPVTEKETPEELIDDDLFGEKLLNDDLFGDQNDLSLFDLDVIDDEVADEGGTEKNTVPGQDDFIEDDDGGGYKEDLRADADYGKYMERSKKESLKKLDRGLGLLSRLKSEF